MRDRLSYTCALLSSYLMVIASVAAKAAPLPAQASPNQVASLPNR
jgi:hypothetical protein